MFGKHWIIKTEYAFNKILEVTAVYNKFFPLIYFKNAKRICNVRMLEQ